VNFHKHHQHNHCQTVEISTAKIPSSIATVSVSQDLFQPASEIVDKLLKEADVECPCPALPAMGNTICIANWFCCAAHPKDSQDLLFTIVIPM